MKDEIQLILTEASQLGIRTEMNNLAINLMVGYSAWMKQTYPDKNYVIDDHEKFYRLAYDLMVNPEEDTDDEPSQVEAPTRKAVKTEEMELVGSYEEFYNRTAEIAAEISAKDESDNEKRVAKNLPPFDNVFIITDVWSLFLYYELIYSLEVLESPIMILATQEFDISSIALDSNIYLLGWHPTFHSDNIVKTLLSRGHKIQDITKIEVVGVNTMEPCQTIPVYIERNQDVWAMGYGLGRPNKDGRCSEYLELYY